MRFYLAIAGDVYVMQICEDVLESAPCTHVFVRCQAVQVIIPGHR